MPTFLRPFATCPTDINLIHAAAKAPLRLARGVSNRGFLTLILIPALIAAAGVRAASCRGLLSMTAPAATSSPSRPDKKRVLTLRRNETPDGSRFTLTSDSPLDDYKSFAEGERICVMIPQAAFVRAQSDANGRGFADMRIEQRDDDTMLSFRLRQGATVAFNQHFNRLDVVFITNEQANSAG
jgi:hypothetical protein